MDPADPRKIQQIMNEEFGKTYAGLDFDPEVVGQVFDPDKEQATCPACATEFSTKESECPECGLCFGT